MTTARASALMVRLRDLTKARKEGGQEDIEKSKDFNRTLGRMMVADLQSRIIRAVDDPIGFGERLVQFWADHFTVRPAGAGQNPLAVAFVDEAIRPHVNGRFEDMFFAADTHPMMLVYLDQISSRGPGSPVARRRPDRNFGLNENLAREYLELFTLGHGNYTEADVKSSARLLTGFTVKVFDGYAADYDPKRHHVGPVTVMGKTFANSAADGRAELTRYLDCSRLSRLAPLPQGEPVSPLVPFPQWRASRSPRAQDHDPRHRHGSRATAANARGARASPRR